MHIPPGADAYAVTLDHPETWMWAHLPSQDSFWLNAFLELSTTYRSTIAGILSGHTHMDEVRRLYDPSGSRLVEVAVSAPGIKPLHGNNPGFKLIEYEVGTKELADFVTYYTTPAAESYGNLNDCFSDEFDCDDGQNIFDCLSGKSLDVVKSIMDRTYTVKHGPPTYETVGGIEVMANQ